MAESDWNREAIEALIEEAEAEHNRMGEWNWAIFESESMDLASDAVQRGLRNAHEREPKLMAALRWLLAELKDEQNNSSDMWTDFQGVVAERDRLLTDLAERDAEIERLKSRVSFLEEW